MKIIEEEIIYDAAKEYAAKPENLFWGDPKMDLAKAFVYGSDFAEEGLRNLAIEFAKWKDENYILKGNYFEISECSLNHWTLEELFIKFVNTKN